MLLSPRKNGLTSLFKEVRAFKDIDGGPHAGISFALENRFCPGSGWHPRQTHAENMAELCFRQQTIGESSPPRKVDKIGFALCTRKAFVEASHCL